MFLFETKDGEPDDFPPDLSPALRSLDPQWEINAKLKKAFREGLRDIICLAATGNRYFKLELEARGVLSENKLHSPGFRRSFKAFLKLVAVHTYPTPKYSRVGADPEKRPALRLTEEFWQKEWVQAVFEKIREIEGKTSGSFTEDVFQAMVDGATGKFISQKTRGGERGKDLITYIAINAARWRRVGEDRDPKENWKEIVNELRRAGFEDYINKKIVGPGKDKNNLENAINAYRQVALYFHHPDYENP
jgi:hypothetical protein